MTRTEWRGQKFMAWIARINPLGVIGQLLLAALFVFALCLLFGVR